MPLMIAERPNGVDSERALAVLWERAGSLPDGLTTQDGGRYRVSYPGRPNARAGPDFLDAKLITDSGQIVTGDVELHLKAPDWYAHGHHSDPKYNGVVLHVVLSSKGHTTTSQHSKMEVPVASLQGLLGTLESARAALRPMAIPEALDEVGAKLDLAGDERFTSRSDGFLLELDRDTADQVVYRSMMEALGYASNRRPFRMLADRVPFATLAILAGEPDSTRALAIHAMLLRGSGLMTISDAVPENKELKRLANRLSPRLPKSGPVPRRLWQLFRVRPSNHPLRRIQGAVQVLESRLESGLANRLREELISGGIGGLEEAFLCKPFIGLARARDIAVNAALPFLHALARQTRDEHLAILSVSAYREASALAENEITREMRRRLAIPAKARLSARRQQGLMRLYRSNRRAKV